MVYMGMLSMIKDSFEVWYNRGKSKQEHASIVINYRDEQRLAIRAFHTTTIEMSAVGIKEGKAFVLPLLKLSENYNHGITSELEAKEEMVKKLLTVLYDGSIGR